MAKPEPRRRGRKPIDPDDESVYVGITLPAKQFADICARARLESVSAPEIIRRDLNEKKLIKTQTGLSAGHLQQ